MSADAVAYLPGQVQILEHLEDADALRGMVPAIRRKVRRQRLLPGMAEGRVTDIVAQRDGLGQRLVQPESRCQRARDLGDLQGMGKPSDEVIAVRMQEDLGLVLQAAEGLGVDDPVPIALEGGAEGVRRLRAGAAAGRGGSSRERAEALLGRLANGAVAPGKADVRAWVAHGTDDERIGARSGGLPSHLSDLAGPERGSRAVEAGLSNAGTQERHRGVRLTLPVYRYTARILREPGAACNPNP
jgi:hypothetical protein